MSTFCRASIAVMAVALTAGCGGLTEAGLSVPVDPGTVVVRVSDQANTPLPNVSVEIGNIPNSVGSTYSVGQHTQSDGTSTFTFIPAGSRTVTITPPAGYAAGADGVRKTVDEVKNQTLTVTFQLVKS